MSARRGQRKVATPTSPKAQALAALAWLKSRGSQRVREGMARYGIPADTAASVPMNVIHEIAKQIGPDHDVALALWDTGYPDARLLAPFVAEADRLTPAQMDRWRRDFDNWGVCDTACFKLFDQSPHAWKKVAQWATLKDEFGKRAAFALLACLALHDKRGGDEPFLKHLPLIEAAATDERNFVKKAVNWALRAIGLRSPALHAAAVALSRRLAASDNSTARWIGKDAEKQLSRPAVKKKLAAARS